MEKWTIKENEIEQLDNIFKLQEDLFIPSICEQEKYSDKNEWIEKIENGGKLLTVYSDNSQLIGYAVAYPESKEVFRIWIVAVRSDFRRRGLWKAMYKIIHNYAKDNNYSKIVLTGSKARFPEMTHFAISNQYKVTNEEKVRDHKRGDIFLRTHFEKEI